MTGDTLQNKKKKTTTVKTIEIDYKKKTYDNFFLISATPKRKLRLIMQDLMNRLLKLHNLYSRMFFVKRF